MHELITLAQAYTSVNPADCPADDPQFFLNTLWNGQDEAAIEKGAQELTAFIAGFADPNAMIAYARRLIKVAKHTPGLESQHNDATFLHELVNLGRTYAAIDPVDDSESGAKDWKAALNRFAIEFEDRFPL
ncbi:hypothetical protein [Egbenema bharatensis]|uniref:hypothetical protein n=1 Tax=Egbenema bharatensis TaxID=3463334 RepID=UPI003A8497E1